MGDLDKIFDSVGSRSLFKNKQILHTPPVDHQSKFQGVNYFVSQSSRPFFRLNADELQVNQVAEFSQFAESLRARLPGIAVDYCYLEFATPIIRDGLDRLGVTPHHRSSFRPIRREYSAMSAATMTDGLRPLLRPTSRNIRA